MRAVLQTAYGSVDDLRVGEVPCPRPADDEVLVRVSAASVHPDVWHVVAGRPAVLRLMGAGLRRPRQPVPGTDVAGTVEAVGRAVTRFRPGDEVFGETLHGVQWVNGGAWAEYATPPQHALPPQPAQVPFEQACAVPTAGLIALNNLPAHQVPPGSRVLVNGAAGGVGAIALQLAKAYGAEVTAVEHTRKLDLVRNLGADRVIDFTRDDFTRTGEQWDLVLDVPGNHPFREVRRAVRPDGRYVLIGHDAFGSGGHRWLGSMPRLLGLVARSAVNPQLRGGSFASPDKRALMATLAGFMESGQLQVVVDSTFGLDEAPQALRRLMSGQALGRVVITP